MRWTSYARNGEDVVLARVLADVDAGFWIDVGAHDPRMDSVTYGFAERGWRGINIEPVPHRHAALVAARPRDVNLAMAAGEHAGKVDVRTLASMCAEHVRGPVHFLSIDVEGAEGAVLRGMDFAAVRPWVVLVQGTDPDSRVPTHAAWEPVLLAARYAFAYGDGINRFYLAAEHAPLAGRFGPPTADKAEAERADLQAARDAAVARLQSVELQLAQLATRVPHLKAQLRAAVAAHAQVHAELLRHVGLIEGLRAEMANLVASRSWRLTAPLRAGNAIAARVRARLARVARTRSAGSVPAAQGPEQEMLLPLTEDAARILAQAPVDGRGRT
jgi:hypothetical protein